MKISDKIKRALKLKSKSFTLIRTGSSKDNDYKLSRDELILISKLIEKEEKRIKEKRRQELYNLWYMRGGSADDSYMLNLFKKLDEEV